MPASVGGETGFPRAPACGVGGCGKTRPSSTLLLPEAWGTRVARSNIQGENQ